MSVISSAGQTMGGENDAHIVKSIGFLQSLDGKSLQKMLEESIKSRYGITKDFSELVDGCLKEPKEDDESEIELELLDEDLMCVVCNRMEVGAKNQLLECAECHSLYHQDCHAPHIQAPFDNWTCNNCSVALPTPENKPAHKTKNSAKKESTGKCSSKSSYKKSSHKC